MKNLIIFSHPNINSYTSAIVNKLKNILEEKNQHVSIVDLYKENFNPVLFKEELFMAQQGDVLTDVKKYQEKITKTDRIILVYPIWWSQMPAMMKGFIDRVFSYGFAYTMNEKGDPKGLLSNKSITVISPLGTNKQMADNSGINKSYEQTQISSVFGFCNMQIENHILLYSVTKSSEYERKTWLENLKNYF